MYIYIYIHSQWIIIHIDHFVTKLNIYSNKMEAHENVNNDDKSPRNSQENTPSFNKDPVTSTSQRNNINSRRFHSDSTFDNDLETVHITATDQNNEVEGVQWFGNNEVIRDFVTNFTEGIRVTDMSGRAKLFIRQRYLNLFSKYDTKYKKSRFTNNTARIIVTIGALLIPALLSVDDEIKERSQASQIIYYTTFSISLIVSLVNALAELMQVSKRFYANATTHQILQQEGWSFLLLRGPYKHYVNHRQCWQRFLYRVEKIHQSAVTSGLLLHRQHDANVSRTAARSILDAMRPNYLPEPPNDAENTSSVTENENEQLPTTFGPVSFSNEHYHDVMHELLQNPFQGNTPIVIIKD